MTDLLDHDLLPRHNDRDPHRSVAGQHLLGGGQSCGDTHTGNAAVDLLATDQCRTESHISYVGGDLLPIGQGLSASHCCPADGDLLPPTNGEATPKARSSAAPSPTRTLVGATPMDRASGWAELRVLADLFDRAQLERIAVANIIRPATKGGNIDATFFAEHLARLEATEHQALLMMKRCYRRVVPAEIRDWQKAERGIGEPLLARFLGHLGDPLIATPHWWEGTGSNRTLMVGEPYERTVSQLWQFCGHGDPHRRKTRGMTADEALALGNPRLKMLVHLIAEGCMKQKDSGARYRGVYDDTREAVTDKVHSVECVRCGPSGKPAQVGSPWNPGHQHAHALRIVGKEVLRDLWLLRKANP
jgi:hypothetical protein